MSFGDFISNRFYRRRLTSEFERYQNIKPPRNPSRRYIDKLVRRLIDQRQAWNARKELSMMGPETVPSLARVLKDARYLVAEWDCGIPAPLDMILELLVPHGGQHILDVAPSLTESSDENTRRTAAIHLAGLGRIETLPTLARLLNDPDGYVRSYVSMGIGRAVDEGRAGEEFRRAAYDLLLEQCDQDWPGDLNGAARTVVQLDAQRAAADFSSSRWLNMKNPNVQFILNACNEASLRLNTSLVRSLFDQSLPLAVGERCYPHDRTAAAALESLALSVGEESRPLLKELLGHDNGHIREAAANGIARLAGVENVTGIVVDRINEVGFSNLSPCERTVFCAFVFDAEVCNGGLLQFFGNSSGDHAVETLEAIQELGHPEAEPRCQRR